MRILLLDIETAPNTVYVWGLFKPHVSPNQIITSGYVMCWAAKWYGQSELYFDSIHKSKPKRMLQRIHKLLEQADVVVHYNGKSFDIPTLQKEFLLHGMRPPSPYRQIDLYLVTRGEFRFPSNKLEYIVKQLDIGEKVKHEGFTLWVRCMAGDDEAWSLMEQYNKGDIIPLEELYTLLRPWIKNHPNYGVYHNGTQQVCPTCGSEDLQRNGFRYTNANKYQRFVCRACGAPSKARDGDFDNDTRRNLVRPIA